MRESLTRNVRWAIDASPFLQWTRADALREEASRRGWSSRSLRELTACQRLTHTLRSSRTGKRLIAFQLHFVNLLRKAAALTPETAAAATGSASSAASSALPTIAAQYAAFNRRLGRPPAGMAELLHRACKSLACLQHWDDVWPALGLQRVDDDDLVSLLESAVFASAECGYHVPRPPGVVFATARSLSLSGCECEANDRLNVGGRSVCRYSVTGRLHRWARFAAETRTSTSSSQKQPADINSAPAAAGGAASASDSWRTAQKSVRLPSERRGGWSCLVALDRTPAVADLSDDRGAVSARSAPATPPSLKSESASWRRADRVTSSANASARSSGAGGRGHSALPPNVRRPSSSSSSSSAGAWWRSRGASGDGAPAPVLLMNRFSALDGLSDDRSGSAGASAAASAAAAADRQPPRAA
jgi:hypothetical protein